MLHLLVIKCSVVFVSCFNAIYTPVSAEVTSLRKNFMGNLKGVNKHDSQRLGF